MTKCRAMLLASVALIATAPRCSAQTPEGTVRGHGGPVRAVVVLADGLLDSAGFDSAIIEWDTVKNRSTRVLRFHDTTVNTLVVRADGCLLSGGEDARIAIWCGTSTTPKQTLTGHSGPISALAAARTGERFVSGSWDRTVRLWGSDGASRVISEHPAPVTSVVFSQDQKSVLSAAYDGSVRLTPIESAAPALKIQLAAAVNGAVRSSDGNYFLASADGVLREIDASLMPVRDFPLPDGPLTTVAISPDGRTIATGGMRAPVTLLDRFTATTKSQILGPGLPLWAVAFSSDGKMLFTGGADRAVRRFEVASGQAVGPSIAPPGVTDITDAKDPGAQVFRACSACHGLKPDDTHLAGPTLAGIMGRRIAMLPGYNFSQSLKAMEIVWTPDTIAKLFEVGPAAYTPGTKMPEQRITDPQDRQALVEWLARVTKP